MAGTKKPVRKPAPAPDDGGWACAKLATTAGPLYIAVDERERERFARDGRVVFTKAEMALILERLKDWTPFRRHQWFEAAVLVKKQFPLANVVEIKGVGDGGRAGERAVPFDSVLGEGDEDPAAEAPAPNGVLPGIG